jgi:ParB family chromosome partitioning protein
MNASKEGVCNRDVLFSDSYCVGRSVHLLPRRTGHASLPRILAAIPIFMVKRSGAFEGRSELLIELRLNSSTGRTRMRSVIEVNPFRCRMWELHDRMEFQVTEQNCKAEIDSFSRFGQLLPALGRRVTNDPEHDVELICGARRLFVARHLNRPLMVDLREMSDREALIAMDIENRQRTDISAYERGMSYSRWIRSGHFSSQEEVARALKVSTSQVSRLLKLSRLPSVIVNAFDSPGEICEGWGGQLLDALDDPHRRVATIQKARAIAAQKVRLAAPEVFRQLLASSADGRKPRRRIRDEVVKQENGSPLFRIRHQRSTIAVVLPVTRVSIKTLQRVRDSITEILIATEQDDPIESYDEAASTRALAGGNLGADVQ